MVKKREALKYYFSVEGETEQWYLQWLQSQINADACSKYTVSFDCKVQKDPLKRAKSLVITSKTEIVHLVDYESNEEVHTTQFRTTIDRMKAAGQLGKEIKYHLGYSNFTFDLWIVLHKADCNQAFANHSQYLAPINSAYDEHFESLDEYKHEDNFKRILSRLTIGNVMDAVQRAISITQRNHQHGYVLHEYKGYRYYKENPSLSIWQAVERILKDCALL